MVTAVEVNVPALSGTAGGTAAFPTVTTNDFIVAPDATVEYNSTNAYNLPATPSSYPNLTISGASVKTAQPAVNITVGGNLSVATGATLSVGTGNFTVTGTSNLVGNFTDASNTGITTFTGLVTKTTGTFTSTAVTSVTNMIFNGGFTNTSGTFTAGAATIGANKTLTPTVTMDFGGTGGLKSTGTLIIAGGAATGVTVSGGPLDAANVDLNSATSVLTLSSGNSTISGTLSTTAGSQLTVSTTGTFTVAGAFTNAGIFTDNNNAAATTFNSLITNTGSFVTSGVTTVSRMVFNGGFTHSSGTFSVPTATVTGTLTPTAAMNFNGTGGLAATGTLTIGAGLGVTVSTNGLAAANVDLNTASSILTLSAGSTTISGTLNTVAGSQLTLSTNGALDVTGAFTNAGTFIDNDNTAASTFNGLVTNTGTFNTTAATNSASKIVFQGGFTHTSGTFTVPTATVTGTLTPTTAVNFTGTGGLSGTGTLTIGAGAGVTVSGGAMTANNLSLGTNTSLLTLSSGNCAISGTLATTAGSLLTVSTTGTFGVTGATTNNGAILDNDNTAATTFTGAFTNGVAGTFTSTAVTTAGRMNFNSGITQNNTTAGAFSAGTIDVNASSTWAGAGAINIASTLTVTGAAVVLTNNNTGNVIVTGVLTGTGKFTQGTNSILKLGNALVPSITTVDFSTNCPNTVEYNFAGAQAIKGTTYCSLTTSGGGDKTPDNNITVNTTLTLTSGVIVLGTNTFTFGASASVAGIPSGTSMIQCSGTAVDVIKNYDAVGSFTFPVGTTTNYTPATINITAATFAGAVGSRNISLVPVAAKAPSQIDNTNSLSRYWKLTSTNMSGISASMTYTYIASEAVAGQEASYVGGYYNNTNWDVTGSVTSPVISFTYNSLSNLSGNYTAGLQNAFVLTYYSRTSGNWETNGTWSTLGLGLGSCTCTPASGGIVIIGGGNTVTKTASTALSISSLQIDAASILDMGTQTGLTIGIFKNIGTGGNGTIKLSGTNLGTAVFPTVTTNNFNSSTDGTVEYNNTNTYNLPTTPTSYPNLTISGVSVKTIQPLINTTINGNLTISAGASLSLTTGDFTVAGTSTMVGNFTDAGSTGTTTFTGAVTKSVGTFTSTSVTSANLMVFNGGFTNTSGVFNGGAATVGANQSLIPTAAMSFAGTGGLTATGTLTIGAGLGVAVSGGPLIAANVDLNTATSILTLSGAAAANTISGTLNTATSSQLTVSSTGTFSVGGVFTSAGTFIDNDNTAASTFTGLVNKTGGTWTSSSVTTPANMVFSGGFTNTLGAFNGGGATLGANQTITPTVAMNFAGGLVGTGNLTIANGALVTTSAGNSAFAGNLSIGTGGLTVSSTGTFAVTGTTANAGTFTDKLERLL